MLERTPWTAKAAPAFGDLKGSAEPAGAGLWVCERHLQMATVIAYKGQRADLSAKLMMTYGLSVPDGPRRVANGTMAVLGLGPRTCLVQREQGAPLEPELTQLLGDSAAVTDQSDGYGVLRLSGPRVRDVLEKCMSIDLHDKVFVVGSVAATSCAHMSVILWRLADEADCAVFEIAVFRSFARSLWHTIEENAAEYGVAIVKDV